MDATDRHHHGKASPNSNAVADELQYISDGDVHSGDRSVSGTHDGDDVGEQRVLDRGNCLVCAKVALERLLDRVAA